MSALKDDVSALRDDESEAKDDGSDDGSEARDEGTDEAEACRPSGCARARGSSRRSEAPSSADTSDHRCQRIGLPEIRCAFIS